MDISQTLGLSSLGIVSLYLLKRAFVRLRLSRAKHPSLRGHSKWSRRIARLVTRFNYDGNYFFRTDGAPDDIVGKRKAGLTKLREEAQLKNAKTIEFIESLENDLSDIQFTTAYRVPFPYRNELPKVLRLGSIVTETDGPKVCDLDGNWRYDLSGSYGVNVFGYEFYKKTLRNGVKKVEALGPVLGPYHPAIKENVELIKSISGLDEISFHMSGTEAVMQAVRLARYHTGRSHLVRFCGAYHGWWDGVQPGVGNRRNTQDVYTLNDLSSKTLKVLETRNDIACILINPLQALNPNADQPSDATLIASDRSINFDRTQYTKWLQTLRKICTQRKIVLIFDEVFTGFRLALGGAQEYFGVSADIVTYGKTLGGGLPVGAVCGKREFMKRFQEHRPADISFARGTFNTHPWVMGTMNAFLKSVTSADRKAVYQSIESLWNGRVSRLNEQLRNLNFPVQFGNMHTVLTTLYTRPSRYNWMFQFYLRAAGVETSWIGSGRMIMSLDLSDKDFEHITECIICAAKQMNDDGWWFSTPHLTNQSIKRAFLIDMLSTRFPILAPILKNSLARKCNSKSKSQNEMLGLSG